MKLEMACSAQAEHGLTGRGPLSVGDEDPCIASIVGIPIVAQREWRTTIRDGATNAKVRRGGWIVPPGTALHSAMADAAIRLGVLDHSYGVRFAAPFTSKTFAERVTQ